MTDVTTPEWDLSHNVLAIRTKIKLQIATVQNCNVPLFCRHLTSWLLGSEKQETIWCELVKLLWKTCEIQSVFKSEEVSNPWSCTLLSMNTKKLAFHASESDFHVLCLNSDALSFPFSEPAVLQHLHLEPTPSYFPARMHNFACDAEHE